MVLQRKVITLTIIMDVKQSLGYESHALMHTAVIMVTLLRVFDP